MLSDYIVLKMNKINSQTDRENMVISYGLELLLDFIFKMLVILFAGWCLGKLWESVVVFIVFGSIRSQAGGIHAKSGWGCTLYTLMILCVSLLFSKMRVILVTNMFILYVICAITVSIKAPKTVNRSCFTKKIILQKKLYANLFIIIFFIIAFLNRGWRNLIVCPLVLEALTLLPDNKK